MFDKRKIKEAYKTLRIGSYWIRLDQIGSDWKRLDQIGSDWIRLDQIGSDWIRSDWIRLGQTVSYDFRTTLG